jgi:hypothetical protein
MNHKDNEIYSTTILAVKRNGVTVIAGDVSRRHIEEYNGKSYRWETLKDLRR